MKGPRLVRLVAVAATGLSLIVGGLAFAPGAVATSAGSLTSAVGGCGTKAAAGYDEVFVTGTFTGLTPNTYYQLELDQATPMQPMGKTPPKVTTAAGGLTLTATDVVSPDLTELYTPGPATFVLAPLDSASGALTLTGTVTITDNDCVPTQLHATPSYASLHPLHFYLYRLSATLTANGAPLPGFDIIFRTKSALLGITTTNAHGVAYLNPLTPISRLTDLMAAGGRYTANFVGPSGINGRLEPSTATAGLIG